VELRKERIDLRSVLQSAIEATRPMIDGQRHELTVDQPLEPMWADADFTRIAQALSNLLNNAAKYTEAGGRIAAVASIDGAAGTIAVIDNGVGIAPEMLPRIFDMFTQLQEYRDRTHGGLGIGLSLARRLIELHGGTLEAASEGLGRGCRFTIRLPLARVQAPDVRRSTKFAGGTRGCRVLIAEDNPDSAEMLSLMLGMKGHDVRVASNGEEAVAIGVEFEPHIAFLDIGMPRVDGFEVARRLRAQFGRNVMLIALTGWGQDEDKRRSQDAGFDRHLTKPPDPDVLDRLIAEAAKGFRI
jgi:CheY-like chemotaxis protein